MRSWRRCPNSRRVPLGPSPNLTTEVDLSLVQEFDEQDQARFITIMNAFMSKKLKVEEISSVYLEFFQHPEDWVVRL